MSRSFSMPVDRDVAAMNAPRGGQFLSNGTYQPLPKGRNAKGVHHNKVYFSMFDTAAWSLHRRLDGHDQKGLLHENSIPPEMWTFYWKLFCHYVQNPNDSSKNVCVLCPVKTNKFHEESLGFKPLFVDPRCRFCEEVQIWWDRFGDYWESHATYKGQKAPDRWKIDKKEYGAVVRDNPVLGQIRSEVKAWQAAVRFIFTVFDLSKLYGERQLDEGEASLSYQLWPGPKGVFDGLLPLFQNKVEFWLTDRPSLMLVTKDCSGEWPKYTVGNAGVFSWSDDVRRYIEDDANLPKLTTGYLGEDVFALILTYEEMCAMMPVVPTQIPGVTSAATPLVPMQAPGINFAARVAAPGMPMPVQQGAVGLMPQQGAPVVAPAAMPVPATAPAPMVMPQAVAMPVPVPTPQPAPQQRRGTSSW